MLQTTQKPPTSAILEDMSLMTRLLFGTTPSSEKLANLKSPEEIWGKKNIKAKIRYRDHFSSCVF